MADPTPDPTHERTDAAAPPTCEEFLHHAGTVLAQKQQDERKGGKRKLAYLVFFVLLIVAMAAGKRLFPEYRHLVRDFGFSVVLIAALVFIKLDPLADLMTSFFRRGRKEGGWDIRQHLLAKHKCFIKNDAWATATGEIVVTPRFIALVKFRYLLNIPIYHTLVRPMRNPVQCIPLTAETRVRFCDPTRIARRMYRLDVSPGGFQDGDRVYLWPSEIRKLLPVLARLGVEVSCPRDL